MLRRPHLTPLAAVVAVLTATAANAGEITVNNLSNDDVVVAVADINLTMEDAQFSSLWIVKAGDTVKIPFSGDEVFTRVIKRGQVITPGGPNPPKLNLLFCDVAPFGVWNTNDTNVLKLKYTKGKEPEVTTLWSKNKPPPPGWSVVPYYKTPKDAVIKFVP